MRTLVFAVAICAVVLPGYDQAKADHVAPLDSPCCAAEQCPEGSTLQKGATHGTSKCCDSSGQNCTVVGNAGFACDFPSGTDGVGCIDGPPDPATCAGGNPNTVDGCVCVLGSCIFSGADCTSSAVAACCGEGACH
jgi:hypothetical protein